MTFPLIRRLICSICLIVGLCGVLAADDTAPPAAIQPFVHSPDLFPILPWDVLHGWKAPHRTPKHGLESIAECNFTLSGFVKPEDLPLCEKLGLAAIMAPSVSDKPWFGKWREMSAEDIDRAVKEMVAATGDSPAVLGYFIMDELEPREVGQRQDQHSEDLQGQTVLFARGRQAVAAGRRERALATGGTRDLD